MEDADSDTRIHPIDDVPAEADPEADTCRICSAPAEPDQPLFYPCKCSGTMRYIHQDCLTTWLAHSKKKTCDVCKHPYSFTKVYAEDMPQHLPFYLLLRQFAQHTLFALLFCLRALLVSFVWLAILPWITVWTWRLYFAMGNSTAWWISARPRTPGSPSSFFFYNLTSRSPTTNLTLPDATSPSSNVTAEPSTFDHFLSHPALRSVSADIFTGQIIATLIVLVFIAVFLLREWISQNARPGVFEDADIPGVDPDDLEMEREREREREAQRERERERHAQREREVQILRERNAQLERMGERLRDLERQRRQSDKDKRAQFIEQHADGTPRHPDRPVKELPTRSSSSRSRVQAAVQEEDAPAGSSSGAPGPSTSTATTGRVPPSGEEIRNASLEAAIRRQGDAQRLDSQGKEPPLAKYKRVRRRLHPDGLGAGGAPAPPISGKGKGREQDSIGYTTGESMFALSSQRGPPLPDAIAALREDRQGHGAFGAATWTLYEFERYEMKRLGLEPLFGPRDEPKDRDPREIILQAEYDRRAAAGQSTMVPFEYALSHRLPHRPATIPDDWTEHFGSAAAEAATWRTRRRLLYEIWRTEASTNGWGDVAIPPELADVELSYEEPRREDLMPPPAPRFSFAQMAYAGPPPPSLPQSQAEIDFNRRALGFDGPRIPIPLSGPEQPDDTVSPALHSESHSQGNVGSFRRIIFDGIPPSAQAPSAQAQPSAQTAVLSQIALFAPQLDTTGAQQKSFTRDNDLRKIERKFEQRRLVQFTPETGGDAEVASGAERSAGLRRAQAGISATAIRPPSAPFSFAAKDPAVAGHLFEPKPASPLPYPLAPFSTSISPASSSSSVTLPPPPPYDGLMLSHSNVSVPRRPPMPTATFPTPTTPPASLRSKVSTPLASPSLATYRAPEEFQDEVEGYFDPALEEEEDLNINNFEKEHAKYFRDAEHVPGFERQLDADDEDDDEEDDEDGLPPLLPDSEEDDPEEDELLPVDEDMRRAAWAHNWEENREMEVQIGEVAEAVEEAGEVVEEADDGALAAQLLEDELGVEDDMEGALEAVGLRGPLYVVAQNAALMIFVLATAMGLGVGLPFTFGKSTALLSLDPKRALQVLHWPIRVMRIVTDPIVDLVLFLLGRIILPSLLRVAKTGFFATFWVTKTAATQMLGREPIDQVIGFIRASYHRAHDQPWDKARDFLISLPSRAIAPSPSPSSSILDRILDSDHPIVQFAEPHFATLGEQIRISSDNFKDGWVRLALGDGNPARIFAICLGYAVIGLMLSFYLNVLTVGTVRSAGRAVRSAVRQQLLVVKVATFIVIELVLFPLGCGINLDLCSIWLFPEASLQSRLAFLKYAPLTATFYHWVVGTMFMYQFAILLAGCRTIMRPGAMWFIKDPSDQNFHPIRDILERPALVQLRKLSVSAVMYGLVVACGVGSIGGLMRLGSHTILPLRWKPREPLSNVPIDLLFLHVLLPYTVRFFRPRKVIRGAASQIWKFLCARLRLTSYMFGSLHSEEEYTPRHTQWLSFTRLTGGKVPDSERKFDGSYRRVPASDNVAVPRDMRATAAVDAKGEPVDDEARRLIDAQNMEAEKANRTAADDYTVVYIPPQFRYRIAAFILALWVLGCVFVAVAVATPIHLGRNVFTLFTSAEVHDGYSFLVGFYTLWACWVVGYAVDRMERRRQRRSSDDPRAEWPLYFAKRSSLWLAKIVYMVFFLGVVIPILIALVVEVYVVLPIRLTLTPSLVPHIRIVDMWALGLIYSKIFLHAHNLRPRDRITRGIRNIKLHGWTSPDPIRATTEVIAPMLVGLLGMLVVPPVAVLTLRRFVPIKLDDRFILMHVYPSIFAAAGFARMIMSATGVLSSWSQSVRDKEFLVEMRLRNYEQDKAKREMEQAKAGEHDID